MSKQSILPAAAILLIGFSGPAFAAMVSETFTYESSVSFGEGGPLKLKAEVHYDNRKTNAPVFVVMHSFRSGIGLIRQNSKRLAEKGFFSVSVAMRGRDGSGGVRDSGGLEIYDIYDGVEAAKKKYASFLNPEHISITGYSGGGGNTMSALTKFPDYFRVGSAFFGMSDYGFDTRTGWYFNGASTTHAKVLNKDIGDPTTNDPAISDKYAARASNLASHNNPYSEIHFFVNEDEKLCPPSNFISYMNNAYANQSVKGQFNNIHLHIGRKNTYADMNGNGKCEADEMQWFPHNYPTETEQAAAESWYLQRLIDGEIPSPVLNDSDALYVAGFVRTGKFGLFIGDGQNAAGELRYNLSVEKKVFDFEILTNDKTVNAKLTVNTEDMKGKKVNTYIDGKLIETVLATDEYTVGKFTHGQNMRMEFADNGIPQ